MDHLTSSSYETPANLFLLSIVYDHGHALFGSQLYYLHAITLGNDTGVRSYDLRQGNMFSLEVMNAPITVMFSLSAGVFTHSERAYLFAR